jgi:L-malate glycosyltransferase
MSRPVKCLFANHVGHFQAGGAERVLVNVLQQLDQEAVTIFLAIPNSRNGQISSILPRHIKKVEHVVPLVRYNMFLWFRALLTILLYPVEVWRLSRLVWREGIEALYANSLLSGVYFASVSLVTNRPLIYHEHNFVEQRPGRIWLAAFKLVTAKARWVVAISKAVRESIERHGVARRKIMVVHNGLEYQAIKRDMLQEMALKGRQRLGLGENSQSLVGMVANLHPWKGHMLVLQTIPIVKQKYPDVLYVFIGKPTIDSHYTALLEFVAENDLREHVRFTGFQEQISELMAAMDLLVVASNPEPFGMVVLEAMQLHKPVVALNCGGPTEIIVDQVSGLLVQNQTTDMASAIQDLLSDAAKRAMIGKTGHMLLQEKFTTQIQVEKLSSVIVGVCE